VGKELLLSHPEVVVKTTCQSFVHHALRRHYVFNISLTESAHGFLHGDACASYAVAAVNGTNLFLGLVDAKCATPPVFCPCNVNSRRCILCASDGEDVSSAAGPSCECPCDCPLELDTCTTGEKQEQKTLPICQRLPAEPPVPPFGSRLSSRASVSTPLSTCFQRVCNDKEGKLACLATAGCSW